MNRNIAVLAVIATPLSAADKLPKAETILDKYIEVTGGKAVYEKHKTQQINGSMEFTGQGIKGPLTTYHALPDKSYTMVQLGSVGTLEQGTDGQIVWERSSMQGPRIKTGPERAAYLRSASLSGQVRWREYFSKVETASLETVDGKPCYKLVLTPAEGKPETRYYDQKTNLLVRTEVVAANPMGEVPVEMNISDYRKVDGLLLPFQLKQKALGREIAITFESVKFNVDIPDGRFHLPDDVKALVKK